MKDSRHVLALLVCTFLGWAPTGTAQTSVKVHYKVSDVAGGFTGALDDGDALGSSVVSLGDLDGDGVLELAVGAAYDDDGGPNHGAVWVVSLKTDGTVQGYQKISDTQGGFGGFLEELDLFGISVANLGDLDGDGITDLAVGAAFDDDGGLDHGAVWILFLNADGTVKTHQKISDTQGGFAGQLHVFQAFGTSLANLGDLDGDGVVDLAVGGPNYLFGAEGAVWILFLNSDGTVKGHQEISDTLGGFTGKLDGNANFGISLATIGDLNGDGVTDVAVGARADDDWRGSVWALFLNADGTVKSNKKIGSGHGGFTGILDNGDYFGSSIASLGDLDGDGVTDLAVGAPGDDDGGNPSCNDYPIFCPDPGAIWLLFLNSNSTVKGQQKISNIAGAFTGPLDDFDWFGVSVAGLGDLTGDNLSEIAVGAWHDDDGGIGLYADRGALWILSILSCGPQQGLAPGCSELVWYDVPKQWLVVGCEIIDCCDSCPGDAVLDWRIRVRGDPFQSIVLYFDNMDSEVADSVQVQGHARWIAEHRRLEILGPGAITLRGIRADPNARLPAAATPRATVERIGLARSDGRMRGRPKRSGILEISVSQTVSGRLIDESTRTYRYWP